MGWWFLYEAVIKSNQQVEVIYNNSMGNDPIVGLALLIFLVLMMIFAIKI
jgi:hypothetical protein